MIKIFRISSYDIVTNVFPRSYPVIKVLKLSIKKFFRVCSKKLDGQAKNILHNFTKFKKIQYFYVSNKLNLSKNLSINTMADLKRLKKNL